MSENETSNSAEQYDPTMEKSRLAVAKAKADNDGRVYRVYCDGIFDMCHTGHMNMLKQAKHMLGPAEKTYLLVGVCSDELTHKFKGKTVMNHHQRCDTMTHLKWVDQVVPEAPWVLTDKFLDKYKIDFVAHDAIPYQDASGESEGEGSDVYSAIKKKGMFMTTQRTPGISTSDLILNIVRDYDKFVQRNLDRGYTKKELGVGRTWEIRAKAHANRELLKEKVDKTKQDWSTLKETWVQYGRQFDPRLYKGKPNKFKEFRSNLKDPYREVKETSKSLSVSAWQSFKYFLWYINPYAYLSGKNIVVFTVIMFLAFLWQYYLYKQVPE